MSQPSQSLEERALAMARAAYDKLKERKASGGVQPKVRLRPPSKGDKKEIEEKFNKVNLKDFSKFTENTLTAAYLERGYDRTRGGYQTGLWPKEVVKHGRASFAARRDTQIMRHISTAFFLAVKKRVKDEDEVQALGVNDRLLLSSNLADSMHVTDQELTALLDTSGMSGRAAKAVRKLKSAVTGDRIAHRRSELVKELVQLATKALQNAGDDEKKAEDAINADTVFQAKLGDLASWDDAAAIADAVKGALADHKTVARCTVDTASAFIADDKYKRKVILVEGLTGNRAVHAELNLLIAYGESGTTSPAKFYGKKRPCAACDLILQYARGQLNYNIEFNPNQGALYVGNVLTALRAIMARINQADLRQVHELFVNIDKKPLLAAQKGQQKVKEVAGAVTGRLSEKAYETAGEGDFDTDSASGDERSYPASEHELMKDFDKLGRKPVETSQPSGDGELDDDGMVGSSQRRKRSDTGDDGPQRKRPK